MLDPLSSMRVVAAFASLTSVLLAFPPGNLRTPKAISGVEFAALFLLPATLTVAAIFITSFGQRAPVRPALAFCAAICHGVALALALLGLLTVYEWYVDPSEPHLEPLVVILGLAAASSEFCSQLLSTKLKQISKNSPSSGAAEVERGA